MSQDKSKYQMTSVREILVEVICRYDDMTPQLKWSDSCFEKGECAYAPICKKEYDTTLTAICDRLTGEIEREKKPLGKLDPQFTHNKKVLAGRRGRNRGLDLAIEVLRKELKGEK